MKMLPGMISPWNTGILSGLSSGMNVLEKYNEIDAQAKARQQSYAVKYGAMASVQQQREANNALLGQLKMEASQRTYKTQATGADGKTYDVYNRNVYNPDTKQFEPQEVSRVPAAKQGPPVTVRNFADGTTRQLDPDTGTWKTLASKPAESGAQSAADKRQDLREKQQAAEKVDSATSKDMSAFDKADDATKAAMLKSAGVPDQVNDPKAEKDSGWLPSHLGGATEHDPDAMIANPDARAQYEAAMTAKHAKALGVSPSGDTPKPATGSQPSMTPDGRQIKYDADGQGYILGPDGKPAPYVADASGTPTSPLAMDAAPADAATPDASDDTADTDAQPSGPGLLAGTQPDDEDESMGSPASEQEDDEDDAAEDQQQQGLLA